MQQPLLEPETIPGPYDTVDIEARRHGFPSCIDHSLHDQRIRFRRRCCVTMLTTWPASCSAHAMPRLKRC
jgi:hypothetical protein